MIMKKKIVGKEETWGRIHQPFFRTFFVLFSRIFYV